ncbi:MAG: hypothetical protein KJ893_06615 [Candidatus Omnitrophica bacterium]|nr:hypothetical protein [Candidatus Omnitrophota bacterium]MBU4479452.1 hypothetical protein [Candidatus Omnitrophota bacterium]
MYKKISLIILLVLITSFGAFADDINNITIDFDVLPYDEIYTIKLKIKNASEENLSLNHPDLQCIQAIIVMNESGNIIQPEGIAKVDPRWQSIILKSGQVFEYSISKQRLDLAKGKELSFPFLTGTSLFGYALEKGKTYRIIVVYRPYGKEKEGICSKEKIIELK